MEYSGSEEAVSRLKGKLSEFDTEYLQQIYEEGRHDEWTDAAFAAIRQILQDRAASLPAGQPATTPHHEEAPDSYFDKDKLISGSLRLTTLSNIFLALAVLSVLGGVVNAAMGLNQGMSFSELVQYPASWLIYPLQGAFTMLASYAILRVVAEVVFLLMDIEANTRRPAPRERLDAKE
jgi:hypothetical protein